MDTMDKVDTVDLMGTTGTSSWIVHDVHRVHYVHRVHADSAGLFVLPPWLGGRFPDHQCTLQLLFRACLPISLQVSLQFF